MAARKIRSVVHRAGAVLALLMAGTVTCSAAGSPSATLENSNLDSQLFYQLLIGEIELRSGEAGNAYEVLLDAARRTKDEQLFRRVTDVASTDSDLIKAG